MQWREISPWQWLPPEMRSGSEERDLSIWLPRHSYQWRENIWTTRIIFSNLQQMEKVFLLNFLVNLLDPECEPVIDIWWQNLSDLCCWSVWLAFHTVYCSQFHCLHPQNSIVISENKVNYDLLHFTTREKFFRARESSLLSRETAILLLEST